MYGLEVWLDLLSEDINLVLRFGPFPAAIFGLALFFHLISPAGETVRSQKHLPSNRPVLNQTAPSAVISENAESEATAQRDNSRVVSVNAFPPISVRRDLTDVILLTCTIALVLIGLVGVISANRTLKAIEKQVEEMKRQTVLNRQVAEATKINADALINSERSLILVSHDAPAGADTWNFQFKATNYGRSPAEIRWFFFEAVTLDRDESLSEWPIYVGTQELMLMHREWVPPNGSVLIGDYNAQSVAIMAGGGAWHELQSGKKKLWIYGVVRYRDKLSSEVYETRFCYWKSPAQSVNLIAGGPSGYNDVT